MPSIINATGFHRVANKNFNQRARAESLTLRNGDLLDIAIISTGFGPGGEAARVAQVALDAVIVNIKRTPNMSVPILLENALKSANHELYWSTRKQTDVYVHLAIAAIENLEKLFIANIGFNSIYLARGERLTRLSLAPAELQSIEDPIGSTALGLEEEISVDIGFHIGEVASETEYYRSQVRGVSGIPVKEDDAILISSVDLLTLPKFSEDQTVQILNFMNIYEGKEAIDHLVTQAIDWGHVGNLSMASLEAGPDQNIDIASTIRTEFIQNPVRFYNSIAMAVVALVSVFAFFFIRNQPQIPDQLVQPSVVANIDREIEIDLTDDQLPTLIVTKFEEVTLEPTSEPNPTALPTKTPASEEAVQNEDEVQSKPQVTRSADTTEEEPDETSTPISEEVEIEAASPQITSTITITDSEGTEISEEEEGEDETVERIFYQPVLRNLSCAAAFENFAKDSNIELQWGWNGRAYGNEYLEIRVGPRGGALTSIGKVFAKPEGGVYRWFITPQGYFLDGVTTEFQWQVVHMAPNGRTVLARSGRGCFTVQ